MLGHREMALDEYVSILRQRWVLILTLAVLGCGLGIGVAHFLPKRYTSQTLVLIQQPTVPGDYVKPVVSEAVGERLASMQQEILSRTRLEPIVRQLGLYRDEINTVPMDDLVGRLRSTISVTPVQAMAETRAEGLPGFNVTVTFQDPGLAQQICSSITSLFIESNTELRQKQADQTTDFLSSQLDDAKSKLDQQDAKLADFQRRYMGSLPDDASTNLNVLTGLSAQLDATNQSLARAQQDKTFAESSLQEQVAALRALPDGSNPQTYEQRLSSLQEQLTALRSKYTDDYPDVIKTKNDIATLNRMIAAEDAASKAAGPVKSTKPPVEPPEIQTLRNEIHQFDQTISDQTAQQADIQQRIKLYQARVESSPAILEQYKQVTRDYQTALDFYNDLLKKRDQSTMATDLERRQQGEQFTILDPANYPDMPSYPNNGLFALGGLGGGVALGLGLTLLLEMRDTSFRNERDVETLLRLPVLALVPVVSPMVQGTDGSGLTVGG
jgi:polysaccharide chain length determinant protein (PEP-CTERM system associated)